MSKILDSLDILVYEVRGFKSIEDSLNFIQKSLSSGRLPDSNDFMVMLGSKSKVFAYFHSDEDQKELAEMLGISVKDLYILINNYTSSTGDINKTGIKDFLNTFSKNQSLRDNFSKSTNLEVPIKDVVPDSIDITRSLKRISSIIEGSDTYDSIKRFLNGLINVTEENNSFYPFLIIAVIFFILGRRKRNNNI
jgi:hypothetical protein